MDEVIRRVAALQGALESGLVADISFDDLDVRIETSAQTICRAGKAANLVAILAQARNETTTNVARSPGYQYSHEHLERRASRLVATEAPSTNSITVGARIRPRLLTAHVAALPYRRVQDLRAAVVACQQHVAIRAIYGERIADGTAFDIRVRVVRRQR